MTRALIAALLAVLVALVILLVIAVVLAATAHAASGGPNVPGPHCWHIAFIGWFCI